MAGLLSIIALAAITSASPVQNLLYESSSSQVVINSKSVVSTEALQNHITPAKLKKRAEDLYKIAERSLDEYGHPTRVIGSEGKLCYLITHL
jgi:aminopeptidase Y